MFYKLFVNNYFFRCISDFYEIDTVGQYRNINTLGFGYHFA